MLQFIDFYTVEAFFFASEMMLTYQNQKLKKLYPSLNL